MTRANVGSLLVFDPSALGVDPAQADKLKSASQDAVVGIVTERGEAGWQTRATAILRGRSRPGPCDMQTT